MMVTKIQIIFLVAFCIIQMCHVSKCAKVSVDQIVAELGVSSEVYTQANDYLTSHKDSSTYDKSVAVCQIFNSAYVPSPNVDQDYLNQIASKARITIPGNQKLLFIKNVICPYVSNPEPDEKYGKSLGLVPHQYLLFKHFRNVQADNSTTGLLEVARKLCKAVYEPETIAVVQNSPSELTEQQLSKFSELAILARTADESSKPEAVKNICAFLNETVCPKQQASELQIPVSLYKKIVAIRKERLNKQSKAEWIVTARQICRELNQVEGVVSKVVPEENDLTSDQLSEAISLIHSAKSAKNNEKILEFRKGCVFLNESLPDEELAKQLGISLEQYQQIVSIRKEHQDPSLTGRLALVIDLCNVVNPADSSVPKNTQVTDEQLKEFGNQVNTIRTSPIDQRISKLRDVCSWIKTNTQIQTNP